MVSTRDFVVKRRMVKDYKGYDYISVMNSEEHSDKPHQKKKVRGSMINSPALFKKIDENTTRVFFSN